MAQVPTEITVRVLETPMRLYRGGRGVSQDALLYWLSSNYETGRKPNPADLRAAVLYVAVSMFEDPDRLAARMRNRPERMGTHLITLDLEPDHGICVCGPSPGGHWSVWGVPAQLRDLVTDVQEV